MYKLKIDLKQFIKFSIVGLSNTIISLSVTYITMYVAVTLCKNLSYNNSVLVFLASILGFAVGVLNSYYWNNKYVFKKTSSGHIIPLLKSYICYGVIFILAYALNEFVFTKCLRLPSYTIPILQVFICTPLNFITNKLWAFK